MSEINQLLPELDNIQIDTFFKEYIRHPQYHECITKDELNSMKPKQIFCIINSKDSGESSANAHWFMIYLIDPNYAIIFDSYGALPPDCVINYVKKVANKYHLEIIRQNSQLQTLGSNSCGYWCIYIILKLLQGETLQQAITNFTENIKQIDKNTNEQKMYNYFKPLLPYFKSLSV